MGREIDQSRYRNLSACMTVLVVLFMAGCAPIISKEALKEVDPDVRFEMILEDPEKFRGRTLLLGGEIIETQNMTEKTVLVVLQRPLGSGNRPTAEEVSGGRFLVIVSGFLDPAIYGPRRKITVLGSVAGKEVRPLGEIHYTYPLIAKKELYLWPLEGASDRPRFYFGVGVGKTF